MAWVEPTIPVSGTVITVAWATSAVVNSQIWLRTMTGGADPPAADRIIRSTSTTATTWGQTTTNCIGDGTIADVKMTNQKVNAATSGSPTSFANLLGANLNGFWEIGSAPDGPVASQSWYAYNHLEFQFPATYAWQMAMNIANQNELYTRTVIAGVAGTWRKIFHAGNFTSAEGMVPSGLIASFRTAAAIASGWTRFTDGDGRILIGAGTTFSQTFTENTAAGSSNWTPSSLITVSAIAVTADAPFLVNVGTNTNVTTSTHTHPAPTLGGLTTAWIPPTRVVVHAIKT